MGRSGENSHRQIVRSLCSDGSQKIDHNLEEILDSRSLTVITLVVSKVKALRHVHRLMDTEYVLKMQKRKGIIARKKL